MSLLDEINLHISWQNIKAFFIYKKTNIINLLEAINNKIHIIYHKLLCAIKDILF